MANPEKELSKEEPKEGLPGGFKIPKEEKSDYRQIEISDATKHLREYEAKTGRTAEESPPPEIPSEEKVTGKPEQKKETTWGDIDSASRKRSARELGLPETASQREIDEIAIEKISIEEIEYYERLLKKKWLGRTKREQLKYVTEGMKKEIKEELNLPESAGLEEIKKAFHEKIAKKSRKVPEHPLEKINKLVTEPLRLMLVRELNIEESSTWEEIQKAADKSRSGEYGLIEDLNIQKAAKWEEMEKAIRKKLTEEYGLPEGESLEKIEEAARQKKTQELKLSEKANWEEIEAALLKKQAEKSGLKEIHKERSKGLREGFAEFIDKNPKTAITAGLAGGTASLTLGILGGLLLGPVALAGLGISGYTVYRGIVRSLSLQHESEEALVELEKKIIEKMKKEKGKLGVPEAASWKEEYESKIKKEAKKFGLEEPADEKDIQDAKRRERGIKLGLGPNAGDFAILKREKEIEEKDYLKLGIPGEAGLEDKIRAVREIEKEAKELGFVETASFENKVKAVYAERARGALIEQAEKEEKSQKDLDEEFEKIKKNIQPTGNYPFDIKKEMATLKAIEPEKRNIKEVSEKGNIKEVSGRESRKRLDDINARQREALALCHNFIEREIETNPDVEKSKLTGWLKKFSENWGFTDEQKKKIEQIIGRYYNQRQKARELRHEKGDRDLIKELTGEELSDEDMKKVTKISVEQAAVVIEADKSVVKKLFEKTKNESVPNYDINGFADIGKHKPVNYIVIRYSADEPTKKHEFQHLKNALLGEVFNKLPVQAEKNDYDLLPNKKRLEKYLRAEQRYGLSRVKNELVAMLHNRGIEEIEEEWQSIFLAKKADNPYDFFADLRETAAYKKDNELAEKIFEKDYKKIVENAVKALSDLIDKGRYSVDKAISFLSPVDLEFWPSNVKRQLRPKPETENKSAP